MIILAVDPGAVVGWAVYDGEILAAFGQFAMGSRWGVDNEVRDVIRGSSGYPHVRRGLRPELAIVEEHSARYHRKAHEGRVGEHKLYASMMANISYRRAVEAALLKREVPSLGITPEEYGAGRYLLADVLAELARAEIAEPDNFRIPAREHQRDAIYLGGWVARRKVWEGIAR